MTHRHISIAKLAEVHRANEDVAALFPLDLSSDVVALRVCIDASTRDPGLFTIAGVAFGFDRAVKANREWECALKGRTFHMTDLNARRGEFDGISDEEVDHIMRVTIAVIKKYASYSIAVSCDADLIGNYLPDSSSPDQDSREMLAAFRSVYGVMCHICMYYLGRRANLHDGLGRHITYIFEKGDEGQGEFRRFLDFLEKKPIEPSLLDYYSFNRATITPKNQIEGIFHSADLVAWEWSKQIERHRANNPMRRSLSVFVGTDKEVKPDKHGLTLSDGDKAFFQYYDPSRLRGSIKGFRDIIDANNEEEIQAALTNWEATR